MYDEKFASIENQLAEIRQTKAAAEYNDYLHRKAIKRRDAIIIVLFVLLVFTNLIWFLYESNMETVVETTETITTIEGVEQNADNGINNIVGGDYNGKAEN